MKTTFTTLIIIVGLLTPTLASADQVGFLINESRVQGQGYLCTYRMADGSTRTLRSNSSCPGAIRQ